MRTLVIGDIHGCYTAFDLLLELVEVQRDDLLVTLGDYVDRGPDSRAVLDRLLELRRREQLVALRGNHEIMLLLARRDPVAAIDWLRVGGAAALASYGARATLEDIPAEHWEFVEDGCVDWWENATHFCVHANAYPDLPLNEQPEHMLFWERFGHPAPHVSGKVMVCGHTAQKSGLPVNLGHAICLDTWAYGTGWLSCLDIDKGFLWQTNQAGQSRQMWLDEV